MEISCFSIATDGSNDRRLEKINHVTVRILVINQDKIVTKCKFICVSLKNPLQKPFSGLLMPLMSKYDILRDNCVSLGVDNASVSVGRYNSVIVKARKENSSIILTGCPCHITHNAASKIKCFSIEELLVDIYFHFDFSSKQKNLFAKFWNFCDQDYCKILKFHSVSWLSMAIYIERMIKLFPFLKSYFLSLQTDEKDRMESAARNKRLIAAFKSYECYAFWGYVNVLTCCSSTVNKSQFDSAKIRYVNPRPLRCFSYLCQITFEQVCFSWACKKVC